MDRRAFVAKGISCGSCGYLALLAFPETLASQQNKAKEEIWNELDEKAVKLFPMYGSCAQSSFASLNAQFALKADQVIPAIMPLTGGIAGKGETCGAVSGSLLALGFFIESSPKVKKQPGAAMRLGGLFFDRFEKEFGSTRCREVIKRQFGRYYDFRKPEELKLYLADSKRENKCLDVVQKSIRIAAAIFLEEL